MSKITIDDLKTLPLDERLQLVEELWYSIHEDPSAVPLTDAQRAELDRRLKAYAADGDAGRPWSEVRADLLRKL